MLNLTKHETDHAHKYPNINNYWHSFAYYDGAQRQKRHIFLSIIVTMRSGTRMSMKIASQAQVRSEIYLYIWSSTPSM